MSCVVVAACFLTNPKQDSFTIRIVVPAGSTEEIVYQEDFAYSDEEISPLGNKITISSGEGLGDTEVVLKPIQVKEENAYEPTYLTPSMPVEMDVEKGAWFKVGVNVQNPTDEDIIVYVEVEGVEVRISDEINSVIEWFDYTENPSAMDDESTIKLPIYPDVTFSYNQTRIIASKPFDTSELTGQTILIDGMPIWNAYFTDLTGDGFPEICATYTWGSGVIDSRVVICDYANGASYELSDRGYFDFTLRQDSNDGLLYVDKTKYNSDELVETGRLVFENNCIQVEGFSNESHQVFQAEILEIHDGYYLVKPVEGSWELSSADRIEVPIRNAHPSPEPEVGDVIEIEYSGEILETYPARIADVYSIKVAAEKGRLNGFELNFDGNTSLQHKMVLTEDAPYWCIFINNEGSNNITVEIGGHVYEVEAETYGHIFRDELWDAGTYSASFASINGMEGTATCYTYKYRMEVTGRLNNAVEDTTYVILSNIENITFEQAWKASGLSGDTADYFDPAEAVIINRTR